MIVVDTDFLSAILKIEELELVLEELSVDEIFVPVQVEKELLDDLERKMDDRIKVEDIDPIEDDELGKGERAVIALADKEDLILMNDRKACEKAAERGLNTVTIPGFLKVLGDETAQRVADKLRDKDSYRFSEEDRKKLGLN